MSRTSAPATVRRQGESLVLFERFLRQRGGWGDSAPLASSLLTQGTLSEFWTWLRTRPGRGTQGAAIVTANRRVSVVIQAWRWLADRDEFEKLVPRPRSIKLPTPPPRRVVAPTWAEMDACIAVAKGWHRQLVMILRFTGLRVQQAMGLRWDDVDLEARTLHIRPELGKSVQERSGRVVPLSAHLVDELATWGRREGWLIVTRRRGIRERQARARDVQGCWERAGVRSEVWGAPSGSTHGQAHHAFRKGFQTELASAGADEGALDYLVGHDPRTVRGRYYRDPSSLPLATAVALIPPLGQPSAAVVLLRPRAQRKGP